MDSGMVGRIKEEEKNKEKGVDIMDGMEGDKAQKDIEEPQDMKTNISNPSEPIQTEDLHRPS